MANTARLGVVLGLNSAEFVQGIEAAKKKTNELGDQFNKMRAGLAIVGASFVATTMKLLQFADQMNDAADAYQVSVRGILDISKALEKAGGSFDNAGRLLGQFSNKVDEAASGSKQAQEAFGKIGISLKDLAELSQEDLLSKAVSNIAAIEDPVTRNAKAFDLFGRAIRGVDITRFATELNNGIKATDSQVAAVQQLSNYMEKLEGIITQVKLTLSEALLPVLKFIDIQMRDLAPVVEAVAWTIDKAFKGAVFSVTALVETIKWAVSTVKNLANFLTPFSGTDFVEETKATNQRFLDNMKQVKSALKGETPILPENKGGGRIVTPFEDKSESKKIEQLLKELKAIEQITDTYRTGLALQVESIDLQTQKLSMTKNDAQVAQVVFDLERKRAEQVAQLENKIAIAKETGADQKVIDALQTQINKVNELTSTYQNAIVNATIANQMFAQSFEGGLAASFQKFQFDAVNTAQYVEQSVDSLFGNMTAAIDRFVETGKFSFADFTKSVIQDLIKIQMRMLMVALFSKALGFMVSSFTTPGMTSNPAFMGPPAPRAEGGNVFGNQSYLVGERGPELFVPNRSGTIVPTPDLFGGSNQPQVVYNGPYIQNMNAIDTQSATQFLARNKDAVYAANMSASRSVPTSVR